MLNILTIITVIYASFWKALYLAAQLITVPTVRLISKGPQKTKLQNGRVIVTSIKIA